MRVRFAPSPTGPLHIGGVRTALFNYLYAKRNSGTFILRIEDTDRSRYVPQAESYILESLNWLGITPDEGPGVGGAKGSYRQSERKALYQKYNHQLIDSKKAYISFDTPDELDKMRKDLQEKGIHSSKYDHSVRLQMRNSLTLSESEVSHLLDNNTPYVTRLKINPGETVQVRDDIRGLVEFNSSELDDKILIKSDGMPTYHMANIIDDHLMDITHVIRGEEWLPSTAHHVLLYQAFGWEEEMPHFAHLPLILKPVGNGKLSKRDGAKFDMPVFPIEWNDDDDEKYQGFREEGFLPEAVVNFLSFLGWNPGTEQELFSMDQLIESFDMNHVRKAGARFDFQKACWYNQHYIAETTDNELSKLLKPIVKNAGYNVSDDTLFNIADLMKDRLETLNQIIEKAAFLFEAPVEIDLKQLKKKWNQDSGDLLKEYVDRISSLDPFVFIDIEKTTKDWMEEKSIGFGQLMPILRLAICGTTQGPDMFRVMEILGGKELNNRIGSAVDRFPSMI